MDYDKLLDRLYYKEHNYDVVEIIGYAFFATS